MSTVEPAIRNYFFGKAFSDLGSTVEAGLASVRAASHNSLSRRFGTVDASADAIADMFVFVGGAGAVLLLAAVHGLVISLISGSLWIAAGTIWLAERVVMWFRGLLMVCPRCHARLPLPHYICDGSACRAVHRRLLPGRFGVLRRQCQCGRRLPATFFLNRGRLASQCPECNQALDRAHTETPKLHIAVVGGPSVGKTAFLHAVVGGLIEQWAPAQRCVPRFVDAREARSYARWQAAIKSGRVPDKTSDREPPAFNLVLERGESRRLFYLHDAAGEVYHDLTDLSAQRFQGYLTGMIFLIDPFALPMLKARYRPAYLRAIRAGESPLEDTLAYLMLSLETHHGLKRGRRVRWPLAVVVGKVDALALDDVLPRLADPQASSDGIRAWLAQRGANAFVTQVETRFTRVRYFGCSALGRTPDGRPEPFESVGVLAPVMWLVDGKRGQLFE